MGQMHQSVDRREESLKFQSPSAPGFLAGEINYCLVAFISVPRVPTHFLPMIKKIKDLLPRLEQQTEF